MQSVTTNSCTLSPESGVDIVDGKMVAVSLPVWLRLDAPAIRPGRWVRLRYQSSIFDDNVRPLIRFGSDDGERVQPMNGMLFGVGEWIGYIPERTTSVSINPVIHRGPFDFSVERVDRVSPLQLMLRGALANPGWIAWMIRMQWIGNREEARRALKMAGTSTGLSAYHRWRRRLSRPIDFDGIDRPRADWSTTPSIRLFMSIGGVTPRALQETVRSLEAQRYRRWTLHYLLDGQYTAAQQAEIRRQLGDDARISEITDATELRQVAADYFDFDFCALISAGDVLPDYALGVVVEAAQRNSSAGAIYGDEDAVGRSGKLHSPVLRPGWSPYFQAARPYLGRLTFVRGGELARQGCGSAAQFIAAHDSLVPKALAGCGKDSVRHVRRILYHRAGSADTTAEDKTANRKNGPQSASRAPAYPEVAVIVLTRDNPECLAECMRGLTDGTDYPNLRITLVDNGSTEIKTQLLLKELKSHPQIDVLERPGPFNFAALCNEAARTTRAPMLVFLNDDVAMRDRGWLKPLVTLAQRPDVGVVGAKLLFPNGRIQHAGVVIGLGGIAAHCYHRMDPAQPGYLDRLQVPHEVGAVTAACIAVERKKFDAVSGFDAANLPVDLNDIDLCLRLAERGLRTVWTPESVLTHRESETRGRTPWSSEVYRVERAYFAARWQAAIRDDFYFHPSLSLFSYSPALA